MSFMKTIQIGWWVEREPRKGTEHTSYAADSIEKMTKPGRYPLMLGFDYGHSIPMPHWILSTIDAEVVGGGHYSGFGGVNYSFRPAKKGPEPTHIQAYTFQLLEMVEKGSVELLPEFADAAAGLKKNHVEWAEKRGFTWESLTAMQAVA